MKTRGRFHSTTEPRRPYHTPLVGQLQAFCENFPMMSLHQSGVARYTRRVATGMRTAASGTACDQ